MNEDYDVSVSVVMPVYNSVRFLEHAVASVCEQRFDSFELLLVDDGSTDGSAELCDKLSERYGQVRTFHKDNGGICSARNFGLARVRGEYVTFCDNDDEFLDGLLEENYCIAKQHNADCVRFGRIMRRLSPGGTLLRESRAVPKAFDVIEQGEFGQKADAFYYGTDGVWSGLYRVATIRALDLNFDESLKRGYEDVLFNDAFCSQCGRVVLNPKAYYVWLRREGYSTSGIIDDNRLLGVKRVVDSEASLFVSSGAAQVHPSLCARQLLDRAMSHLTGNYYNRSARLASQRNLFASVRGILAPHKAMFDGVSLSPRYTLLYNLLMGRMYALLHMYLRGGVGARSVKARLGGC